MFSVRYTYGGANRITKQKNGRSMSRIRNPVRRIIESAAKSGDDINRGLLKRAKNHPLVLFRPAGSAYKLDENESGQKKNR